MNYRRSQIDKRRLCKRRDTQQTVGTLDQVLKLSGLYRCSASGGGDSKIQIMPWSQMSCISLGVVAGQWSRRHRDSDHSRQYIEDSGPCEDSVSRQVLVEVRGGLGQ